MINWSIFLTNDKLWFGIVDQWSMQLPDYPKQLIRFISIMNMSTTLQFCLLHQA